MGVRVLCPRTISNQKSNSISDLSLFLQNFWEFCRPHTIIGTTLQVLTAYLFASAKAGLHFERLNVLALAWISCLCVNIYVVGINQIFDIKLDKVNKPYLPLASGAFSKGFAIQLVTALGVAALLSSYFLGLYLFATISTIFLIGTVYSIPFTYLKGKPIAAALAISTARGLVLNLGAFLHFSESLTGKTTLPFSVIAFALFYFGLGWVISLLKDIPDLSGDRAFGIKTFAVRIGAQKVLYLAFGILAISYTGLTCAGFLDFQIQVASGLAAAHILILVFLGFKMKTIQIHQAQSVYDYYMLIWKFFYLEFALYLICFFQ